jgi:hypothetical protein
MSNAMAMTRLPHPLLHIAVAAPAMLVAATCTVPFLRADMPTAWWHLAALGAALAAAAGTVVLIARSRLAVEDGHLVHRLVTPRGTRVPLVDIVAVRAGRAGCPCAVVCGCPSSEPYIDVVTPAGTALRITSEAWQGADTLLDDLHAAVDRAGQAA